MKARVWIGLLGAVALAAGVLVVALLGGRSEPPELAAQTVITPTPSLSYAEIVDAVAREGVELPRDIEPSVVEELYSILVSLAPEAHSMSIMRFTEVYFRGYERTSDRYVLVSWDTEFDNGNRAGEAFLVEPRGSGWAVLATAGWIN